MVVVTDSMAGLRRQLPSRDKARLLGIAGCPGVGKSTLATALARTSGATVVPMDGFHYADVELRRRGLLDVKGAPETFDAEGYAALLGRIRAGQEHVLAPAFDRDLEQPIAGSIPVPPTGLVITEGNYLLLPEPRWQRVRARLDAVWFLRLDDAVRRARLVARHIAFGKSPAQAEAWVARVDDANARRVAASMDAADRVVDVA